MTETAPKPVAYWFLLMCFWIVGTAVIGAITRLTDSGLSMMSWDAVEFWWPSSARIAEYYAAYQLTPESRITQFTSEEFLPRFFWEWFHRNWARALGLIALIGLIVFAIRRQLPPNVRWIAIAAPFLIGFQGFLGWFMVYSGFVNDMGVNHYRLALHLGGAFVAFGLFYWAALRTLAPVPDWHLPRLSWALAFVVLCITLLFGAFTAGLNAADASHTWPLFHPGQFLPNALCDGQEAWHWSCWVNSPRGVHFIHRNVAMIAAGLIAIAAIPTLRTAPEPAARRISFAALLVVLIQMLLGIWLVVTGGLIADPTAAKQTVAVLHQVGALTLLMVCLSALYGRRSAGP